MKKLDVENKALNGRTFNEELSGIVGSVAGPAKGLLVNNQAAPEAPAPAPELPKEAPKKKV